MFVRAHKISSSSPWISITMFPLSLYLLHVCLHSPLLSPSTATVHPAFSQINISWVMKSNLLLSLGTRLLSPFSMFFFLLKGGEIFSSFQSLFPHTTQVFLPFLRSFPPCYSHCSLPDHPSLTSSLSCLLTWTSVICSRLPWLRVDFGICDFFLIIAPHSPVPWDI